MTEIEDVQLLENIELVRKRSEMIFVQVKSLYINFVPGAFGHVRECAPSEIKFFHLHKVKVSTWACQVKMCETAIQSFLIFRYTRDQRDICDGLDQGEKMFNAELASAV